MRILLIRTSAMGDVVHALPVLTALRRALPRAKIGWVVEQALAPLLYGHPDLDDLFIVKLRLWRRRPFAADTRREVGDFWRAFDPFGPDVVLDLMGNHKGGILAALTLCDRRIGFARRFRREPSSAMWISEGVAPRGVHAVDRGLALAEHLGVAPEPADFGAGKILRTCPPETARDLEAHPEPFALIHPGAAWPSKRYPPVLWGEAATLLQAESGLAVRVAAAPGEEGLAEEVVLASRGAARCVLAPSLPSLAAWIRASDLILGGDTGPLHLAHAMGKKTLFLMGPTDPERHGPYRAPQRVLYQRPTDRSRRRRSAEAESGLQELAPRRVVDAALRVLAEEPIRISLTPSGRRATL